MWGVAQLETQFTVTEPTLRSSHPQRALGVGLASSCFISLELVRTGTWFPLCSLDKQFLSGEDLRNCFFVAEVTECLAVNKVYTLRTQPALLCPVHMSVSAAVGTVTHSD